MFTWTRLNVRITCLSCSNITEDTPHSDVTIIIELDVTSSGEKISVRCKTMKRPIHWNLTLIQKVFITLDLTSQITLCFHYKYQPANETTRNAQIQGVGKMEFLCYKSTWNWTKMPESPGSVHRNSMWIKIQHMQQCADIYSLQNYSTCFGCHSTHHQEY